MNIDELTLGEVKQLKNMMSGNNQDTLNCQLGEKVIIRTYSAGVWFGILEQKMRNELILKDARRMYKWWAQQSISLSGVAKYGIKQDKSRITPAVERVWLEAIEILTLTPEAIKSIQEAKEDVAD